jgi:hypothetical protein
MFLERVRRDLHRVLAVSVAQQQPQVSDDEAERPVVANLLDVNEFVSAHERVHVFSPVRR